VERPCPQPKGDLGLSWRKVKGQRVNESTSQRVKARPSQGQVMSGALVIHVILVASRQTELLGTSWNHSKTGNLSVVLEPN